MTILRFLTLLILLKNLITFNLSLMLSSIYKILIAVFVDYYLYSYL